MEYHVLTHACGAVLALCAVFIFYFTFLSIRGFLAHRAAEASGHAARGVSTNSFLLGLSLPTLLRVSSVATCLCSCHCVVQALAANWIVLEDRRDEGLRYISPVANPATLDVSDLGKLCMAFSKLGPPVYVLTKMCTYLFFFFKSRTVVANQKMNWFHKGVLFITLQMVTFSASGLWLITGDVSKLDRTCIFWVQPWQVILMAVADMGISAIYCYLFIAPLRETINANRAMRLGVPSGAIARVKVAPADTVEATPASAAAAASSAAARSRGSALEAVLRKNMISCVGTIISTTIALSFILSSHLLDDAHMRKASWFAGTCDLVITCFSIAHLMHKSPASNAVAATKDAAVTHKHPPITSGSGGRHPPAAAATAGTAAAPEIRDATVIGVSQRRSDNHHLSPLHAQAASSPVGAQPVSRDAPPPLHNRFMVATATPEPPEAEVSAPPSFVAAGSGAGGAVASEVEMQQPVSSKMEVV